MALRVRTARSLDELGTIMGGIGHYFGVEFAPEDVERFGRLMPLERAHAAYDGDRFVAGAGAFPFELSVPGATVPCAGVSIVGVHPTDRRRGLLRRLMSALHETARSNGEPLAALWASEETIYGRFGYGHAAFMLQVEADRTKVRIDSSATPHRRRFVDHDEALRLFPRIYERVRKQSPGHVSRTRAWWEGRRLGDQPGNRRGAGPLQRVVIERGSRPVGYALYRIGQSGDSWSTWKKIVKVVEAVGVDDEAMREVWRFLFEVDWTDRVEATGLPTDHPLLHLADRPNLLGLQMFDGLWVRVLDVGGALRARSYRPGSVRIEVLPDRESVDNGGVWEIADGEVRRSRRRADIRLDVAALGALYLGGTKASQLARVGQVTELARGGLSRTDTILASDRQPWCPEVF